MKRLKRTKWIAGAAAIAAAVFLIANPAAVQSAVGSAINDCLEVIIPSLFAFTVLAIFLQKSGLYRSALRFLTFPLSKLLRMDEELCAVFLLGNIGGYPVGAKLLSELVNSGRLSAEDAGRMLKCCFASGPAFVVGLVGSRVFGSVKAGLLLFSACFCASLVMAAAVRIGGEIKLLPAENKPHITPELFINSVTDGARVMFTVCVMITAFSVIAAALRAAGVFGFFGKFFGSSTIFPALLEITRIKEIPLSPAAMPVCAALLSFGGVCVLLQIAAVGKGVPLRGFLLSRAPAAALAAAFAMPFSRNFLPEEIPVFAPAAPFTSNAALSACVLLMCVILLIERGRDN